MTKPTQKISCKGCKAMRSNGECMLGKKLKEIGIPLEPCCKPVSTKQYVEELEHYIGVLSFNLRVTKDILKGNQKH